MTSATEEAADPFFTAVARGFHQDFEAEHWETERLVVEWDRCFGFQVDERWVATCGAYSRTMTVPGARVAVAAVSLVTVAPPFRRRGLLNQMMRHQLEDVRQRGAEPVALLWASESSIYGRYGYGHTAPRLQISGATRSTAFLPTAPQSSGSVDEVSAEEFVVIAAELHSTLLRDRPGALNRTSAWWAVVTFDPPSWRRGASALRFAVHLDVSGQADGYAVFRLADGDQAASPGKEVRVGELDATDAGAYASLWRYLLDLDLVRSFSRNSAPTDEPLRYLVADQRAIKTEVSDGTYARLVDLPTALTARSYAAEVDTLVRIHDPLLPANDGVWRLEAGPEGSRVTPSDRNPDLTMGIREIGAAYLGGTSLNTLHRVGLAEEHRAGAVRAMASALSWPVPPFCPDFF